MLNRRKAVRIVMLVMLVASGPMVGTAFTRQDAPPKPPDKLALGRGQVKQLLLLISPDKNGKISKQEWMKFIEAEFNRLDKDESGELDVRELVQSQSRIRPFASVGK
jgi:EF hand domain-containing protein